MNSPRTLFLLLIALLVLCFGLAADLQPQFQAAGKAAATNRTIFSACCSATAAASLRTVPLSRPTPIITAAITRRFLTTTPPSRRRTWPRTPAPSPATTRARRNSFLGPPRDWIDAFGRHFIPNRHTHLDEGGPADDLSNSKEVREILPWLKLSAELDPENVKTYVVTAFWLRTRLNQVAEAEQVLREGLRHNPDNPQLLFELGRIYFENYHNPARARNIWEAALRSWARQKPGVPQSERLKIINENFDDRFLFEQLQTNLAQLEEKAGNRRRGHRPLGTGQTRLARAGRHQKHIDELKQKPCEPMNCQTVNRGQFDSTI